MESASVLYQKIKTDTRFRQTFVVFICCCGTFLVLGWNLGQAGPTLLDLQILARCSLEEASLFLTAMSAGYLVSSFLVSVTFDRFDKYLHLVFGNIGVSAVMAAIPWSIYFELMITMHVLKGFTCGFVDTVVSTLLIHLVGIDCRTYMQVLYLFFTFGGIITPLASSPFLTPVEYNNKNDTTTQRHMPTNFTADHLQSITMNIREDARFNYSALIITMNNIIPLHENLTKTLGIDVIKNASEDTNDRVVTDVYKAYTISAGISLFSAIPFLIIYFQFNNDLSVEKTASKSEKINKANSLPLKFRFLVCIVLFLTSATHAALEESFGGFLATFAVKQFQWTKYMASYVTSVFWGCLFAGSLLGILLAPLFRISYFLCFYSLMISSSFLCLLVLTLHTIDVGIWITAVMNGFFMSVIAPLLYAWTEEDFMHVSARVTALLSVSASVGGILSPIFLGEMMQESPIWFVYILLGESLILHILLVIGMILCRHTRKYHNDSKSKIVLNVILENTQSAIQNIYINDIAEETHF